MNVRFFIKLFNRDIAKYLFQIMLRDVHKWRVSVGGVDNFVETRDAQLKS